MKTDTTDPAGSPHAPPHSSSAGARPLRLLILLGVLLVFGGALLYDWVIAPPRVKAAYEKLNNTVKEYNEFGLTNGAKKSGAGEVRTVTLNKGGLLYSQDIQEILGMSPVKVEKSERYTIEHYSWWGWIPRKTNYITVLYIGNPDQHHYSTHYANAMPEDELIPGKIPQPPADNSSADSKVAAVPAGESGESPPMVGPGNGPPAGGGGKGKGRPQGNADASESETKGADEGAKKSGEPKKKAEEPGK